MKWNPSKYNILGIWFSNDLSKITEINTMDKLAEIQYLFNVWTKRTCTPLGRLAVLKSLVLSKLIYLWILLPNPPDSEIRNIQKMCFDFVWDKKTDKIKRNYSIQSVKNGGIDIYQM